MLNGRENEIFSTFFMKLKLSTKEDIVAASAIDLIIKLEPKEPSYSLVVRGFEPRICLPLS